MKPLGRFDIEIKCLIADDSLSAAIHKHKGVGLRWCLHGEFHASHAKRVQYSESVEILGE